MCNLIFNNFFFKYFVSLNKNKKIKFISSPTYLHWTIEHHTDFKLNVFIEVIQCLSNLSLLMRFMNWNECLEAFITTCGIYSGASAKASCADHQLGSSTSWQTLQVSNTS